MELRRYIAIAWAYKWPLLLVPLIAAVVGFGFTYVLSQRYVGTATVQIIPQEAEPRTLTFHSEDGASVVATGVRDPAELLAQGIIESLASREVAQLIVQDLGLNAVAPPPQGLDALKNWLTSTANDIWSWLRYGYVGRRSPADDAIDSVQRGITANLIRGSYYMKISATGRDPGVAAAMANSAVKAFLIHSRRVASTAAGERRVFLESQVSAARQRAETARQRVLETSQTTDTVQGESVRRALDALAQSRAVLRDKEATLAGLTQTLAAAQDQLNSVDESMQTVQTTTGADQPSQATTRITAPNPLYQGLQERVFALRQQVAGLEARQESPQALLRLQDEQSLADAREQLAQAEAQLAKTEAEVTTVHQTQGSPPTGSTVQTTSPNPMRQALQQQVYSLQQQIGALRAAREDADTQVQARQRDAKTAIGHDTQLATLNEELSLADDEYRRRSVDYQNAALEEARPVSQVRQIDAAAPPLYPSFPVKILFAGIAAAAGFMIALVLVFIRHTMDLSIRSVAEAEAALPLRLLAVVPVRRNGYTHRLRTVRGWIHEQGARDA